MSLNDPKPLRVIRKVPKTTHASVDTYPENWSGVIEGILSIDVQTAHAKLEKAISLREPATGSAILAALDEAQECMVLAKKLAARARREYELYKEIHETWLELKRSAARTALEEEKKMGNLSKQITQDMILDQIRATWTDEYLDQMTKLKNFQAAVHTLEHLADAWRDRPRSLAAMKDILINLGSPMLHKK